jgi:hypothetical protein
MPKRVLYVCHGCGGYIYSGEKSKVVSAQHGKVYHYHYDHGLDCLADRYQSEQMDLDFGDNTEHVAVRGEQ